MLGSFVAPGSRRSSDPVIGPSAALVVAAISATESVKLWRGQQDDCCAPRVRRTDNRRLLRHHRRLLLLLNGRSEPDPSSTALE
jgi:hypothetical protein